MLRVFVPSRNITGDKISITDAKQVHHLKNVLRLKVNDAIAVFDEQGKEYAGKAKSITTSIQLVITNLVSSSTPKPTVNLTVACAIPKQSGMDNIVDKLTQLGVVKIIPTQTERVIVKFDQKKKDQRLGRWKKIAESASGQSQRNNLPQIPAIMTFKDVIRASKDCEIKLIPVLSGERIPLREVLKDKAFHTSIILIGPEGDFSEEEVAYAKEAGFIPVSLGPLVLRVETAAVAAASFIIFNAHC